MKYNKIYLSSPFFNDLEVENVRAAEAVLRKLGFDVFVPMDCQIDKTTINDEEDDKEWATKTFLSDKNAIDDCDLMVLLYYGMYSDSGTAWEGGYAYAKNIPVIVVHCQDRAKNNLMITNGSHVNLGSIAELETYDFEHLTKSNFFGHTLQS